jgi:TP901 family phage tail tape measure protein
MGSAAVLGVLVRAKGIGAVNSQLAGMNANMAKTSATGGRMGAAIKKGLMIGAAAIAALGVGLFKLGAAFDDAYDTIRVGTGATGKKLQGLKDDFKSVVKSVPASFKDASTAIADLNTRLGLTGRPLQDRAKQFLELSRITKTDVATNIKDVTRAFGDWEVKTKDQSGQLDKFFRAAQSSGATVSDLAKQVVQFGAPLRQVGFSLDEATAMFASFEKAGVNTQTMMPGIKMAMKTFFEEGIDPKKGLQAAFKGIQDGSIDAAGAMDIFGQRAGGDMIEAVQQGRFDLDEMTKSLANGSDTIIQAGKDTMDFGEKWTMIKNRVLVGLEPVAMRVFDGMGAAMDKLPGIAAKIAPVIVAMAAPFIAVGRAAGDVVGWFRQHETVSLALGAALGVVTTALVTLRVVALAQMIPMLARTAAAWVLMNLAMLANPAVLIVVALAALVAGLVVAWRESETFRAIVTGAWEAIKKVVGAVIAFIVPLITAAWNAIKAVTSVVWGAIKAVIGVVWDGIKAYVTVALAVITAVVTTAWTVIKAVTTTVWNVIKAVITTVWAGIQAVITTVLDALKKIITTAWNAIKKVTTTIWNAIEKVITTVWDGIKAVTTTVLSALKSAITAAWNAIKSVTSTVWNAIKSVLTTIWDTIKSVVSAALGVLKSTITTVWNAIKTTTSTVWGAVKTAIIDPVRSAVGWVIDKVKWLADKLEAGFRSIWGIAKDFAGGLKDRIVSAFKGVVNKIGGFINKIISVVNKIPGVNIGYKFTPLAQGGTLSSAGAVQELARGGVVNRPMAIVGEEAPRHPEYVIPTNPAYRGRATELMASAAQKMGMEGFARGGVLGNADTLASVAKKMGAGPKSTLALFMAAVVESGMQNLSYGDRDSRGILQIRDSTARPMGINNMSVAQSAAAFLGRGFWNKGSAMSLSRSGMSAGQVAQQTQGSAFPARYDQERGRALSFLKSAKGDKKGLGDLLKGVLLTGAGSSAAMDPGQFLKLLPGVGSLPGWIQGLGKHALSGVSKWIKDKVASLAPSGGGGGGSTTGLTDQVKDAVSYARSNGWSGGINSGFRSRAKQQALYDLYKSGRGNLAAPPGNSNHERGLAVDVSQPDQFARAMARMGEGRLYRKVPGEPWHFSTTGYAQGGVLDGARKAMTSPFVGSFATGGTVPRDGMALVHKGERVTPPGRSDGPMVHIENYNVTDAAHDEERLARKVGFRMRALGAID